MKIFIFSTLFLLLTAKGYAASFGELVNQLEQHSALKTLGHQKEVINFEGESKSAWNDPILRLDASNFPVENPEFNRTPLTGIQATYSQAIPLTSKYKNLEKSYNAKSQSINYAKQILKRRLIAQIWQNAITKEKMIKENKVRIENIAWLKKMISVSNKLYANGKLSQQAILDLKIRASQIKTDVEKTKEQLKQLQINLSAILDSSQHDHQIVLNTVPWNYLDHYQNPISINTPEEAMLKLEESAAEFMAKAQEDNTTPDLTLGLSYRHRNDIDSVGDFVGVFVSMPLSFSNSKQTANLKSAIEKKYAAQSILRNYQNQLKTRQITLKSEILEIRNELSILKKETIQLAETSREITAKAYQVGQSSYIELLKSELQLQDLLLKTIRLNAKLKEKKMNYLYEMGNALFPGGNS